jgi:hypothetical protein
MTQNQKSGKLFGMNTAEGWMKKGVVTCRYGPNSARAGDRPMAVHAVMGQTA